MASRSGKARAAPTPFKQVRRSISAFLVIGRPHFLDSTVCERITGDDSSDQGLHAVVVLSDLLHHLIDDDFVIAFQLSTQRVGQ